jgi:hypothetical protein
LRSALAICLNSSFPTAIYWGPELRLLYNDAWAPILGERHPWALGRPAAEVWADIWDVVAPQFAGVIDTGEGFSTYDQMICMGRNSARRERYWNYSLTPDLTGWLWTGLIERISQDRRSRTCDEDRRRARSKSF